MSNEMFPPTEIELQEMIQQLSKQLENDHYQEDWLKIHEEKKILEKQLKQLLINNQIL